MQRRCRFSKVLADISDSFEGLIAAAARGNSSLPGARSHHVPHGAQQCLLCKAQAEINSLHPRTALSGSILSPYCVRCTGLLAAHFISQRY